MRDSLGTGIRFPLAAAPDGRLATSSGIRDIEEAIRIILFTVKGERFARPRLGTRLPDYVFDSMDANTLGSIRSEVADALHAWEPRIELLLVEVVPVDGGLEGKLEISVRYRVRGSRSVFDKVFPYSPRDGGQP